MDIPYMYQIYTVYKYTKSERNIHIYKYICIRERESEKERGRERESEREREHPYLITLLIKMCVYIYTVYICALYTQHSFLRVLISKSARF